MASAVEPIALAHWRRTIADMYATVRAAPREARAPVCQQFRTRRDTLFKTHDQSPLSRAQRAAFSSLEYYGYDATWRIIGRFEPEPRNGILTVDIADDVVLRYARVGRVQFDIRGRRSSLEVYWILSYGGGLFLPFRDATSGDGSFGGGRYLYDTAKGADLRADAFVLDFNYAYNPSCAYHPCWVCPLAPTAIICRSRFQPAKSFFETRPVPVIETRTRVTTNDARALPEENS